MAQSTLDAFVLTTDKHATVEDDDNVENVKQAVVGTKSSRHAVRLQAGGVTTVLGLVDTIKLKEAYARVIVVTLSWRHVDACGADRVVVANELSGAAYDFRPPHNRKKGVDAETTPTMSYNEICGIVDVGNDIADLLMESEHNHIIVIDGYPKGHIYARLAVCVSMLCLKLRRCAKAVTHRATPPNDPTCKCALSVFKTCRSVGDMSAAAATYYNSSLAHVFP